MNTMHPAIHELKKRLLDRYGERLVRFIVHGSYARGEHTPESDIDIMISLNHPVDYQLKFAIWNWDGTNTERCYVSRWRIKNRATNCAIFSNKSNDGRKSSTALQLSQGNQKWGKIPALFRPSSPC